jgi:uncharacterized protein
MAWFVDVNVWVAAFREDHPHQPVARDWLDSAMRAGEEIYVTIHVLAAFLRLVTNRRIMTPPNTTLEALDFTDWLIEQPNVKRHPSRDEWAAFRALVETEKLTGDSIPDAHLAAIAQNVGAVFVTFDKDFKKLLPPKSLLLLKG